MLRHWSNAAKNYAVRGLSLDAAQTLPLHGFTDFQPAGSRLAINRRHL